MAFKTDFGIKFNHKNSRKRDRMRLLPRINWLIYFKKSIDSLSNCFTLAKVIFEMKTWNHQSGLGFRDTKTATLKCFTPRQWKFLLNEGMNYCTVRPIKSQNPAPGNRQYFAQILTDLSIFWEIRRTSGHTTSRNGHKTSNSLFEPCVEKWTPST